MYITWHTHYIDRSFRFFKIHFGERPKFSGKGSIDLMREGLFRPGLREMFREGYVQRPQEFGLGFSISKEQAENDLYVGPMTRHDDEPDPDEVIAETVKERKNFIGKIVKDITWDQRICTVTFADDSTLEFIGWGNDEDEGLDIEVGPKQDIVISNSVIADMNAMMIDNPDLPPVTPAQVQDMFDAVDKEIMRKHLNED